MSLRGLPAALAGGAEIVCVNTASRELPAAAAAAWTAQAAASLARVQPAIVFVKIDSRLKGHVRLGIETCLRSFGRCDAILAPAIPAQNRIVQNGHIVGHGVPAPIDIQALLGAIDGVAVPDSATEADMERLARQHDPSTTLLVGASGLGTGLARTLVPGEAAAVLRPSLPLLFAIGSHDPATLAQVERLRGLAGLDVRETTNGAFAQDLPSAHVTLARAVSQSDRPGHGLILARFGRSVATQLSQDRFASVLLCGGETAQTVLDDLGIGSLVLLGEAASGVPLAQAQVGARTLTILTKSGGFGTPDDLIRLAEVARPGPSGPSSQTAGTLP